MPILAMTVHVHNPLTGRTSVLNRGTDVQGKALSLIDDPDVWVDPDEAAAARSEYEAAQAEEAEPADADPVVEPPRSGKGSGRDSWAEFATANGVTVGEDDTRDDIVQALADADVIE